MELVNRERKILRILGKLKGMDFVLVGGYAVSSLTLHRFSVDCDLVVSKSLDKIKSILKEEGYEPEIKKEGFDVIYGGKFESYKKKVNSTYVTVDLLINSLVSRGTNASWSFDYIKKHSVTSEIESIPVVVPEKELLVAMKIHSGRKADIRDIIMLIKGCNLEKVFEHTKRGNRQLLEDRINNILKMLDDKKLIDSLKGIFRIKRDVEIDISRAKSSMIKLKKLLL